MVEELYKKFEKKRAEALEQSEIKEVSPDKEKEIIREVVKEEIQKTQPVPANDQTVQQIKVEPKEKQIKLLTDLAFDKGIAHAVEVAKRLDNPYLVDEFHDTLVDEFYNKLIESGNLKAL